MKMKNIGTAIAAAAACFAVTSAVAADTRDFRSLLADHYRHAEEAVSAKDAQRWSRDTYRADAVVVGEGAKEPIRGQAALLPVLESIVKDTKRCTIKPDPAFDANDGLGYSFATWTCKPEKAGEADYSVRALYVWKRGADGWKVVAEMYGMGEM